MKTNLISTQSKSLLAAAVLACGVITPGAHASPFTVTVDVSSFASSGFLLDCAAYDVNGQTGDSFAYIDNVRLMNKNQLIDPPGMLDFESNSMHGFDASLNPSAVAVQDAGAYFGHALRIGEISQYYVSFADREFSSANATSLVFDFEYQGATSGGFVHDAFVASILDPTTFHPLISGLSGQGDFLEMSNGLLRKSAGVGAVPASPVPEPSALLLLGFGLLVPLSARRRTRK